MKKIFTILLGIAIGIVVMPVALAYTEGVDPPYENPDIPYSSFEYEGEVHSLPQDPFFENMIEDIESQPFFLRTNPLVSGDTAQYLYGYGYGYFQEQGYGYGYGFGYGYNYFTYYSDGWWNEGVDSEIEKFGMGMGENYGEFRIPVTDNVSTALPAQMTFGAEDLGAGVSLPAGLTMTADGGTWDGTLDVTADSDAGNISGFGDNAVNVNIDLGDGCDDCTIELSVPAVVFFPVPSGFSDGGIVRIRTAVTTYDVSECTNEYDTEGDMDDSTSYTLDMEAVDHCYVSDGDYIYVATNHFSEFGAGDAVSDSPSQTTGYYMKKIARQKTVLAEGSVSIFEPQTIFDYEDLAELRMSSWQYPVIQQMIDLGLFRGAFVNDRQLFQMNATMTRGMAATVICRYMECDEKAIVTAPFEDVPANAYYAAAVSYLKEQGIVEGKTANIFDPNGSISRAEFFKMAINAYLTLHPSLSAEWGLLLQSNDVTFDDVTKANWYYGYMALAQHTGTLDGYAEGSKLYAKGGNSVTRVEAAAMLSKLLSL